MNISWHVNTTRIRCTARMHYLEFVEGADKDNLHKLTSVLREMPVTVLPPKGYAKKNPCTRGCFILIRSPGPPLPPLSFQKWK